MCLSASCFRRDLTHHRLHLLIIQGVLLVVDLEDLVGEEGDLEAFLHLEVLEEGEGTY